MSIDLMPLTKTRIVRGEEETSVIPCLAMTFYLEDTLHLIGPALARAVSRFLDFIPPETLQSCWASEEMKKLTSAKIKRDLKTPENMPENRDLFYLLYSQGEYGAPGTHGILLFADKFEPEEENSTNLLRFELPWEIAKGDGVEEIINLAKNIAEEIPFTVGTVGFGLSYHNFDQFARKQVNEIISRYLGFDPSAEECRLVMRWRIPSANWINFLSTATLENLGGLKALEGAVPGTEIESLEKGVMVRAAEYPPLGDINQGATDIGLLPDFDRFIKPARFRMWKFRWADKSEVDSWLDRFDALESGEWCNR